MFSTLETYISMQPKGPLGEVPVGSDEYKMYQGLADAHTNVVDYLTKLAGVGNPYVTDDLRRLEIEYGMEYIPVLTNEERIKRLAVRVYTKDTDGSISGLEVILRFLGFDVYVYEAESTGSAPSGSPFYLVNGPEYTQTQVLRNRCSTTTPRKTRCNKSPIRKFRCGSVSDTATLVSYTPTANYNMIFRIGGTLTAGVPEVVNIPSRLESLFIETVLRYKRIDTWAALYINFTGGVYGYGYFPFGLSPFGL